MTDKTTVTFADSGARIAWEMALHIANYERAQERDTQTRQYFLELVHDCRNVLQGGNPVSSRQPR